ncbi:MAG TPA: PAS domain S-box protein [Comamonas sp.]
MLGPFVIEDASYRSTHHIVQIEHNTSLVLLSLAVAFISSCAAFYMAHTNRQAAAISHRRVSLICASMVLGLGIWTMHFIGMLAMHLPFKIGYNPLVTGLSIIPGMVAAGFALWSLQSERPSDLRILVGGVLVGAGIGLMHYSGIAALELEGNVFFHLPGFLLSLLLGFIFSITAFFVHRWLFSRGLSELAWVWHLLPPSLMTLAIASMHYVSMDALHIRTATAQVRHNVHQAGIANNIELSFAIAAMAAVVFLILGLANAILRYRDLWRAVAVRDARLNAMIDTAKDGVITIDANGLVQDFNPAAQRIFGYEKEEVIGHNVAMLMPSPLGEQHDGHLHKHIGRPDKPITVNGREVLGLHKDGRHVPLQLAIGKALTPGGTIFVGYLQDISERKRTDAQLRIAASVFEHVREGVAIVDATHNISDVNPAFLQLLEIRREDCIGKPLEYLYTKAKEPPDMSKLWQTVATQQYWQSEIMLTRSDGAAWMQRLSISPVLNELHRPHHFIAVISDVSERPNLESMLSNTELHDSGTGLPSRKLFLEHVSRSMLIGKRNGFYEAVIVLKVMPAPSTHVSKPDYNGMLRMLATLIQQQLRHTDTLGRLSDQQLAVLLLGIKDMHALHMLIQRITQSINEASARATQFGIQEIQLGYTSTFQAHQTAQELIEVAVADLVSWKSNTDAQLQ